MHDPWIERISASIDGLLSEADEQALHAHLDECTECRRIAGELRKVVAVAHEAAEVAPARDLWPGIEATIAGTAVDPAAQQGRQAGRASAVTPLHGHPRRYRMTHGPRRLSLSMPQLAAAAVVLMFMTGSAVWLVSGRPDTASVAAAGTLIQSAGGEPRSTQTVATRSASPDYTGDLAELERALEQNRARLDPATVEVIERSLEAIDRAIEDARSALAADPGNPYLHRQLDNTMRKKIDVLRRATGAQRARS
jgi:anti-sigma factor RsiW